MSKVIYSPSEDPLELDTPNEVGILGLQERLADVRLMLKLREYLWQQLDANLGKYLAAEFELKYAPSVQQLICPIIKRGAKGYQKLQVSYYFGSFSSVLRSQFTSIVKAIGKTRTFRFAQGLPIEVKFDTGLLHIAQRYDADLRQRLRQKESDYVLQEQLQKEMECEQIRLLLGLNEQEFEELQLLSLKAGLHPNGGVDLQNLEVSDKQSALALQLQTKNLDLLPEIFGSSADLGANFDRYLILQGKKLQANVMDLSDPELAQRIGQYLAYHQAQLAEKDLVPTQTTISTYQKPSEPPEPKHMRVSKERTGLFLDQLLDEVKFRNKHPQALQGTAFQATQALAQAQEERRLALEIEGENYLDTPTKVARIEHLVKAQQQPQSKRVLEFLEQEAAQRQVYAEQIALQNQVRPHLDAIKSKLLYDLRLIASRILGHIFTHWDYQAFKNQYQMYEYRYYLLQQAQESGEDPSRIATLLKSMEELSHESILGASLTNNHFQAVEVQVAQQHYDLSQIALTFLTQALRTPLKLVHLGLELIRDVGLEVGLDGVDFSKISTREVGIEMLDFPSFAENWIEQKVIQQLDHQLLATYNIEDLTTYNQFFALKEQGKLGKIPERKATNLQCFEQMLEQVTDSHRHACEYFALQRFKYDPLTPAQAMQEAIEEQATNAKVSTAQDVKEEQLLPTKSKALQAILPQDIANEINPVWQYAAASSERYAETFKETKAQHLQQIAQQLQQSSSTSLFNQDNTVLNDQTPSLPKSAEHVFATNLTRQNESNPATDLTQDLVVTTDLVAVNNVNNGQERAKQQESSQDLQQDGTVYQPSQKDLAKTNLNSTHTSSEQESHLIGNKVQEAKESFSALLGSQELETQEQEKQVAAFDLLINKVEQESFRQQQDFLAQKQQRLEQQLQRLEQQKVTKTQPQHQQLRKAYNSLQQQEYEEVSQLQANLQQLELLQEELHAPKKIAPTPEQEAFLSLVAELNAHTQNPAQRELQQQSYAYRIEQAWQQKQASNEILSVATVEQKALLVDFFKAMQREVTRIEVTSIVESFSKGFQKQLEKEKRSFTWGEVNDANPWHRIAQSQNTFLTSILRRRQRLDKCLLFTKSFLDRIPLAMFIHENDAPYLDKPRMIKALVKQLSALGRSEDGINQANSPLAPHELLDPQLSLLANVERIVDQRYARKDQHFLNEQMSKFLRLTRKSGTLYHEIQAKQKQQADQVKAQKNLKTTLATAMASESQRIENAIELNNSVSSSQGSNELIATAILPTVAYDQEYANNHLVSLKQEMQELIDEINMQVHEHFAFIYEVIVAVCQSHKKEMPWHSTLDAEQVEILGFDLREVLEELKAKGITTADLLRVCYSEYHEQALILDALLGQVQTLEHLEQRYQQEQEKVVITQYVSNPDDHYAMLDHAAFEQWQEQRKVRQAVTANELTQLLTRLQPKVQNADTVLTARQVEKAKNQVAQAMQDVTNFAATTITTVYSQDGQPLQMQRPPITAKGIDSDLAKTVRSEIKQVQERIDVGNQGYRTLTSTPMQEQSLLLEGQSRKVGGRNAVTGTPMSLLSSGSEVVTAQAITNSASISSRRKRSKVKAAPNLLSAQVSSKQGIAAQEMKKQEVELYNEEEFLAATSQITATLDADYAAYLDNLEQANVATLEQAKLAREEKPFAKPLAYGLRQEFASLQDQAPIVGMASLPAHAQNSESYFEPNRLLEQKIAQLTAAKQEEQEQVVSPSTFALTSQDLSSTSLREKRKKRVKTYPLLVSEPRTNAEVMSLLGLDTTSKDKAQLTPLDLKATSSLVMRTDNEEKEEQQLLEQLLALNLHIVPRVRRKVSLRNVDQVYKQLEQEYSYDWETFFTDPAVVAYLSRFPQCKKLLNVFNYKYEKESLVTSVSTSSHMNIEKRNNLITPKDTPNSLSLVTSAIDGKQARQVEVTANTNSSPRTVIQAKAHDQSQAVTNFHLVANANLSEPEWVQRGAKAKVRKVTHVLNDDFTLSSQGKEPTSSIQDQDIGSSLPNAVQGRRRKRKTDYKQG